MKEAEKKEYEFVSLSLAMGFVASVGALIFFAWLTDEVLEGDAQHFDNVTRLAVHEVASPFMTTAMRVISFLGSSVFLTLATVAVLLWFLFQKWQREAKLFGVTMLGASLLNMILKLAFQRPRPLPYFNLSMPETYSFPSGHSLASCCFFGALAALIAARVVSKRVRVVVWLVAVTMFLLIGLSRIYLGVHYTTDVIAGFTAALIWIMFVRFVELQLQRRRRRLSVSG